MIKALRTVTMRLGSPLPRKLASNLAIARSTLFFLSLLIGNRKVLSWVGLADTISSPWRWTMFWAVTLVAAALLAREFAEKFHRSAVRRAWQSQRSSLQRLQF